MAIVYTNFFGGSFFGGGFFGQGTETQLPDQTPRGGPGGYASNKYSSLTRTRDLPGLKTMIEADDEMIVKAALELLTKRTLQ